MPKVIIWRDGAIETEFDPGHRDWRIGRSETNDITLLDPRKSVSRFHAELREENGRWVFIDLSSQNGSWNREGQRINRLVLEHGNEVLLGEYRLAFEDPQAVVPPPAAFGGDTAPQLETASVPSTPEHTLVLPPKGTAPVTAPPVPSMTPRETAPVMTPSTAPTPTPPPLSPSPSPSATASPAAPVTSPAASRPTATKAPTPPPPAAVAGAAGAAPPLRKGVNPAILVLLLLVMIGAVGAVAYRLLMGSAEDAPVAEVQTPATPEPTAPPTAPPTDPAADTPIESPVPSEPTPAPSSETPGATPPSSSETAPPTATPPPPAATPSTDARPTSSPDSNAPSSKAGPRQGAATARPKAAAPAEDSAALVTRYQAGRRALEAGRFAEAQRVLEGVVAQNPKFRDAATLLERAKAWQASAREKLLRDAEAAEGSGDWARAISLYERAGAAEQANAARGKMHAAGEDAYRKARQFDARNRPTEAVAFYQQAVSWLPDSDARKATAQERLAALKGGAE